MAYSEVRYTVDAGYVASPTFDIAFTDEDGDYLGKGYLRSAHVKVYKDGTEITGGDLTFDETVSPPTVTIGGGSVPLVAGEVILIRRVTPRGIDSRLTDFADGVGLTAADFDTAQVQNLLLIQEALDLIEGRGQVFARARISMNAGRTEVSVENLNAASGGTDYLTDLTFDELPSDNTYWVGVTPVLASGSGVPPTVIIGVVGKTTSGFSIRHSDIATSDFEHLDIIVLS